MGAFMCTMGPEAFFNTLPLRLQEFSLDSLTYAQDSRSYLLPAVKRHLKRGDLAFFLTYFIPTATNLGIKAEEHKSGADYSLTKVKKYETMIVQIWELLPIFCRYNSPKLAEAFKTLLDHLETMVNKNVLGLRPVALRAFSETIIHCKVTPVVTDQVKKTRLGLARISHDYV